MSDKYAWWQKGIIYQIYPRSYQDANRDGVGDLPGIIQRLDYLQSLNIDAIWLSPIYPSPMHDFGYDVADYTGIHPMFGTMADFDHLLAEAHQRGLKLIIDLVPNHTSDEHPWFVESRSSRDNPKRDWYIWHDPAPDGGPPNNWISYFGGPAWTFDEQTGQYYMHQFVTQQPELNYRHPDVLPAMLDVMRFWLDKGVDGFRVDVIWLMWKHEDFLDEPPRADFEGGDPHGRLQHIYTQNQPEVHNIIRQMRALTDQYDDRVLVGEIYLPFEELVKYYGQNDEVHLPHNMHLIDLPWQAPVIRAAVEHYESLLPADAWPTWVLGNHDRTRIATRVGRDQARVGLMMLLTLRGTPTSYYGEEIGMADVAIPPEFIQDPPAVNQPEVADIVGRDPVRTPMQWDDSPNAGFAPADCVPWLPLAPDYKQRNVIAGQADPHSELSLYRALAELRRAEPALNTGSIEMIEPAAGASDLLIYRRAAESHGDFLIVLNLGADAHTLDLHHIAPTAQIALSTTLAREGNVDLSALAVEPDEGLILRLLDS